MVIQALEEDDRVRLVTRTTHCLTPYPDYVSLIATGQLSSCLTPNYSPSQHNVVAPTNVCIDFTVGAFDGSLGAGKMIQVSGFFLLVSGSSLVTCS